MYRRRRHRSRCRGQRRGHFGQHRFTRNSWGIFLHRGGRILRCGCDVRRNRRRLLPIHGENRNGLTDLDHIAFGYEMLHEYAVFWRGNLRIHLVGGDFNDGLISRDALAFFHDPSDDGRFSHALAHFR